MSPLGSAANPLLVAVVGSGPSGFYAAEALFKSSVAVTVDIIERLPSPYGLVRSGVAPDHPKLKQVIQLYEKIATNVDFNLIANVTVGIDISVDELCQAYHAVIFACGAESDRKLALANENLTGSYTATEFVGWYNGHPDYRNRVFDLSHEVAVIVGQGNVAADVSRILSKTVDELKYTDIAQHALDVLAESKVKEIHVIGRRGPAQAKFSAKELREFGDLADCTPIVLEDELMLNLESEQELAEKANIANKKVYDLFCSFSKNKATQLSSRHCYFRFLMSPKQLIGKARLEKIIFEKNKLHGVPFQQAAQGTSETVTLETGILFRSIGYHGVAINSVPFDERRGIIPNQNGRVVQDKKIVPQLYTVGWIKRGPSGIIGTNRACSIETVDSLLADLEQLNQSNKKTGNKAIYQLLAAKNTRHLSYDDWMRIDAKEVECGKAKGKPREKYTSIEEMLAVVE